MQGKAVQKHLTKSIVPSVVCYVVGELSNTFKKIFIRIWQRERKTIYQIYFLTNEWQ